MATDLMEIQEKLGIEPGKKSWKKWILWSLILLIVIAGVAVWALRRKSGPPAATAMHYSTQPARKGDLTVTVSATGQLKPTRTVDVGSQVSGIIDEVLVNYNDPVKAGQVICKLNTDKLEAQVSLDKAQLAAAKANVDSAKVTVAADEAYYKQILDAQQRSKTHVIAQHDVDSAKADYDRAVVAVTTSEAQVAQMEANLKSDETNLGYAVIKSPVDGTVLARDVEPGQTIQAAMSVTTMFEIAENLKKMILEVSIDEADIGQVKAGQHVMFTVDAYPGRKFPGTITLVRYNATTSSNVVTYTTDISVDNDDFLLRPGMTATATITTLSVENALLVPNQALRFLPSGVSGGGADDDRGGGGFGGGFMMGPMGGGGNRNNQQNTSSVAAAANMPRVWKVGANNRPVAVNVTTGETDGKFTEIKSGNLTEGTPLIVEATKDTK
jgi:HlyD family secretion protein